MAEYEIFRAAAVLHQAFISGTPQSRGAWSPNVDVFLTEKEVIIKAELAGVNKEELEVTTVHNRIIIRGVRRDDDRRESCRFLVMEIHYGPFEAIIDLPPGFDPSMAKAVYSNGFLTVRVPAKTSADRSTRRVPIEETVDMNQAVDS